MAGFFKNCLKKTLTMKFTLFNTPVLFLWEPLSNMFFTLLCFLSASFLILSVSFHLLPLSCADFCDYQCAASSQCFFLFCVSLSALPLTVRMSVSLSFLHVLSVCLWSLLSVFGRRLSQGSPPQLLPLLRQRAELPMPLFSPPV